MIEKYSREDAVSKQLHIARISKPPLSLPAMPHPSVWIGSRRILKESAYRQPGLWIKQQLLQGMKEPFQPSPPAHRCMLLICSGNDNNCNLFPTAFSLLSWEQNYNDQFSTFTTLHFSYHRTSNQKIKFLNWQQAYRKLNCNKGTMQSAMAWYHTSPPCRYKLQKHSQLLQHCIVQVPFQEWEPSDSSSCS